MYQGVEGHPVLNYCWYIVEYLPKPSEVKKMNLQPNKDLTSDGWKALLSNLSPTVEDLGLATCKLDEAKAISPPTNGDGVTPC